MTIQQLHDELRFHRQGRHSEFEPGKAQYSTQIFLTGRFWYERIETQNLGKAQALGALPAMAALKTFRKEQTQKRIFTTMYFQRFPDYSKKPERQYNVHNIL